MNGVTFEAHIPQVQGAFKSIAEGGARVTLELDPVAAAQYYAFKVGADRVGGGPLKVTVELMEGASYG